MKKKDEQKYQHILDATAKLILSGSVGDVSTTKIAKLVGISQSSIYVYFKSRETLLLELYLRELNRLYAGDQAQDVNDLDFKGKLRVYLDQLFTFAKAQPNSMTVIQKIKGDVTFDHDSEKEVTRIIKQSPVQQLLFQGIEDGTLRKVDISLHRNIVFSTVKLHADNLCAGVYDEAAVPFDNVVSMIMNAVLA